MDPIPCPPYLELLRHRQSHRLSCLPFLEVSANFEMNNVDSDALFQPFLLHADSCKFENCAELVAPKRTVSEGESFLVHWALVLATPMFNSGLENSPQRSGAGKSTYNVR